MRKVTMVDLFAGAGGGALGADMHDVEHLALVEWDADAAATLRAYGHDNVLNQDVRAVDWASTLSEAPDILMASPPCQAFSTAGKRKGAADDRNGWPWLWQTVDKLRDVGLGPTWLVAENVPGLLLHSKKHCGDPQQCPGCYFHQVVVPEFKARFSWVDIWRCNASSWGVPQHRRRVFLVCGLKKLRQPEPTHGDPAKLKQAQMFGPTLKPWSTVRDALGLDAWGTATGFQGGKRGEPQSSDKPASQPVASGKALGGLYAFKFDPKHPPHQLDKPAGALRSGGDGHSPPHDYGAVALRGASGGDAQPLLESEPLDWSARETSLFAPSRAIGTKANASIRVIGGGHNPNTPEDKTRNYSDLTDEPSTTIAARAAGNAGPFVETVHPAIDPRYTLDRPSPAVTTTEAKGTRASQASGWKFNGGPDRAADLLMATIGRRRLTVEECAVLQDFPRDYPFQGRTKASKYKQIGNAIPRRLAAAVLGPIVEALRGGQS